MHEEFVDFSEFEETDSARAGCGGACFGSDKERGVEDVDGNVGRHIALIEGRIFLRECIRNSVRARLPFPVRTYATVAEWQQQRRETPPEGVMISMHRGGAEGCVASLQALSEILPEVPVIVLAYDDDPDLTRTAIRHGAKGYIPFTMGFDVVVAAVRLILAGGTYVPAHLLLQTPPSGSGTPERSPAASTPSSRELAVIRAIQRGMSNKVIAYDLNMCESTVKVHVRNIMRKMNAKNRTDIAIKAQSSFPLLPR